MRSAALSWLAAPALVLVLALGAGATSAAAATTPSWQFTPVAAPAPPVGVTPGPFAVPLGRVGQISFWAPDRGLLITGGTGDDPQDSFSDGPVPAGLYAYDGAAWHLLSTVCGGAHGRIAWAGPDEFWTISDQRPGPFVGTTPPSDVSLSLCHFVDGQVVASYAMPIGQADAYSPMSAAACVNPDDCWFGGEDTIGSTPGAFELHWDGANLTALQEPEDHAVDDSTEFQGQIYESVVIGPDDVPVSTADAATPAVLHRIGTGEDGPFTDVYAYDQSSGAVLPTYAPQASPDDLQGFALSTNGGVQGSGASQLWAAADPTVGPAEPQPLTILTDNPQPGAAPAGWSQLNLTGTGTGGCPTLAGALAAVPSDSGDPLALTDYPLAGDVAGAEPDGTSDGAIAAVPGTDAAWLALVHQQAGGYLNQAPELALIDDRGCVEQLVSGDPDNPDVDSELDQQPGQSTPPGAAGPISCPAPDDCWMATDNGWLYHWTDGTQYPVDTDPSFAGIITVRPPDAATAVTFSDVPPPDDSGASTPVPPAPTGPPVKLGGGSAKPLITHVKVKLRRATTTLVMTFTVTARARVQLVAERHGKVVARTARRQFGRGRHTLELKLDPRRYPTHIKVNVTPVSRAS